MKKHVSLLITSMALVLSCGVFSKTNKNQQAVEPVNAATTDYSSCETYYNANNKTSLFSAVRTVAKASRNIGSYDNLWEIYKSAYIRSDGKIFDYYSSKSNFAPGTDQAGNYSGEGDVYNREHSIPKSWWGGGTSNQGSDAFIVVPTDGYVNSKRSNYPFGYVSSATYTSSGGFSKLGSGKSAYGYTGTVFEPDDSLKGDFARIQYYAIVGWDASYGWTTGDGAKCFKGSYDETNFGFTNYSIKLFSEWSKLDPVSDWERSVNAKVQAKQGNVNPFIDHPEYADVIWKDATGYTKYAEDSTTPSVTSISKTSVSLEKGGNTTTINATSSNGANIKWTTSNSSVCQISASSSASGANITLTSGSSTGTATITASVDGGSVTKTCTVTVTNQKTLSSISVSGQKTSFTVGDSFSFGGTVTANYSDSTSSDVTSAATFSGYDLSTTGQQTVTVTYAHSSGTKTTSYQITVSETEPDSGTFEGTYNLNNFEQSWDMTNSSNQGSYILCPANADESVVTIDGIFANKSIASDVVITINCATYGSGTNPSTGTFKIYNSSNCSTLVTSTQSGSLPTDKNYKDAIYTASQSNASKFSSDLVILITKPGKQMRIKSITVEFTYESQSTTSLEAIAVKTSPKTSYSVGDTFDPSGLVITRAYSDSTSDEYSYSSHESEFSFSPSTSTALTTSNTSVTISYGGKTTSLTISVVQKTLSSISVSSAPTKTVYYSGDYFDPTGLVIRRTYSNGTYDTYTYAGHTSEFSFSPSTSTALTTNNNSVTISYNNKTTTQAITVNQAGQETLVLSSGSGVTSYKFGESLDTTGWSLIYNNGKGSSTDVISQGQFDSIEFIGTKGIKATYNNLTSNTVDVTVTNKDASSEPVVLLETDNLSTSLADSTSGWSAQGNGSNYANSHSPYLVKMDSTGDYITAKVNTSASQITVSLGVKMIGGANTSSFTVTAKDANGATISSISSQTLTISGKQNDIVTPTATLSNPNGATIKSIVFTFTKGSNVGVGKGSISADSTSTFSPKQALAWAQYFVDEVGGLCDAGGNTSQANVNAIKAKWSTLSNEYTWMLDDSKDYFAEHTSNAVIARALGMYSRIVSRYGQTNFIKNSSGNTIVNSVVVNPLSVIQQSNAVLIVLVIGFVGLSAVGGYIFIKKRKEN